MLKKLKNNNASGYIDVVVIILSAMLVLALAVSVFPVYVAKSQLDTFAQELCREAEICGRIGSETTSREIVLREKLGITPAVSWSKTGNIQLNEEFSVTLEIEYDIGFGGFASFPVILSAKAAGKSEVYHK
ncbi:MAG: DUF4320 family protein [Clostridia bacterium]|nr:DUF4320 family protein [Clostridia bacterium]